MDSRERTFRALSLEEPDRVPVDLWMSAGFRRKLEAALGTPVEAFLDRHDVDLRYIEGPAYIGPPLRRFADGSAEDLWAVRAGERAELALGRSKPCASSAST
jgi:hypothetical protein